MLTPEQKKDLELYTNLLESGVEDQEILDEYLRLSELAESDSVLPAQDTLAADSETVGEISAAFREGTPEFEARLSREEERARQREIEAIKANWNNLDINQKSQTLSQITGKPIKESYEQIASFPDEAELIVVSHGMGETPTMAEKMGATAKSMLSGAGRVAGATLDQALSPFDASSEGFVESLSRTGGSTPIDNPDEQRNLFGSIGQDILRDPYNVPALFLPYKKVESGVDKFLKAKNFLQSSRVGRGAIKGATEGLMEEGTRAFLQGIAGDDQEVSPFAIGAGALGGGVLGGIGGALRGRSLSKFGMQTPESYYTKMGPDAERITKETYDNLSVPLINDYNYPRRIKSLREEQAALGAKRQKAYQDAEEAGFETLGENLKKGEDLNETLGSLSGGTEDIIANALKARRENITRGFKESKISPERAESLLNELDRVEKNYFLSRRSIDGSPEGIKSFNTKKVDEVRGYSPKDIITGEPMGPVYEKDLNSLYGARGSMDTDLDRVYGSMGADRKLTDLEETNLFGRELLDMAIDDRLQNILKFTGDKDLSPINRALKETEGLPSLYDQEGLLRSIGGGRTGGDIQSLNKSGLFQVLFPSSGVKERQLGALISNPKIQALVRSQLLTSQNQDALEESLFGDN